MYFVHWRLLTVTALLLTFTVAMKYPTDPGRSYTYLALGDSYTIGEQVPVTGNFPNQVRRILGKKGISMKTPAIVAKTGWTTDELQQAITNKRIRRHYDFVTLLIGVNNQYRGRALSAYSAEFESLLKQAIGFAGNEPSHVIVLSIPDWGVTPFAKGRNREQISQEIDAYNKVNRDVAARYKVHYADITPGTRKAAEDPSLLAPDGLHPSAREYAKWAELVAAVMQRMM